MNLFLRDFDAEDAQRDAPPVAAVAPRPEPPRSFSAEEVGRLLAEARETAFARGRDEGAAAARVEAETALSARIAAALEALQGRFDDLLGQDEVRRGELERDVLDLLADAGARIAPEFLAAYSADLALARIRDGLRMASGSSRLSIRLSPGIAAAIGAEVAALGQGRGAGAPPEVIADPALADGEARLDWDHGGMSYSLDQVCAALLEALREAAAKLKDDQEKVG
ncbi:MAG: hypothetical protein AB7S99_03320 [Pseudodonghicola sp.]